MSEKKESEQQGFYVKWNEDQTVGHAYDLGYDIVVMKVSDTGWEFEEDMPVVVNIHAAYGLAFEIEEKSFESAMKEVKSILRGQAESFLN